MHTDAVVKRHPLHDLSPTATTGFCVAPAPEGWEVRLQGAFTPRWLGSFTGRLAALGISILSGAARRVSSTQWSARFTFRTADGRAPEGIDFLALAEAAAGHAPAPRIALDSYDLRRESDGAIRLEVRGRDQLGFLASLLRGFHLFSLFPAEISVDTRGGRIHDTFLLRSVGGLSPSAEAQLALEESLHSLLQAR